VSHEAIYKSLYIQTRWLFRKEMRSHLRTKRKFLHANNHKAASRGPIVEAVFIRDRPSHVEDRVIPGHREGNLILGANNSFIATVVERQSRYYTGKGCREGRELCCFCTHRADDKAA